MAAPSPLYLKPGVRLANVGGDLVVLDVGSGSYACLPGLGGATSAAQPDGRLEATPRAIQALLDAGIAGPAPRAAEGRPAPPLPTVGAWRASAVVLTSEDRYRMIRAYLGAAPSVWRCSFASLVARAARQRPAAPDPNAAARNRDAQAFDQLLPFAPFQGECLFRSFLLLSFLRTAGRDATWVIAVRTYPFQAHCWLQAGDTVLDDAPERLLGYVPILAV